MAPTKCILSRFNLHHSVHKFLVCVEVGNSLLYCSYLVQFKFRKLVYLVYWSVSSQFICCSVLLPKHQNVGKVHLREQGRGERKIQKNTTIIVPSSQLYISLLERFLSSCPAVPHLGWWHFHYRLLLDSDPAGPPQLPAALLVSAAVGPSHDQWWMCLPGWSRACWLGARGSCGRGCGGWCERHGPPRKAWWPDSSGCLQWSWRGE